MLTNSLAVGNVWHKRYTPKVHQFNYKLNSWLIDINDYQDLGLISKLLRIGKFGCYSFDPKKYIRDDLGSLTEKVRQQLTKLGAILHGNEQIFLLGQLTNFGLYFSPLNLYICYLNEQCNYILAEVSNTPWNERHYYLLDMQQPNQIVAKNFHVSPFWTINQNYKWTFDISPSKMYFQIDNYQGESKVFSAGYYVEFTSITDKNNIRRHIIRQPFSVWKIVLAIYYEALKIFMKKIPFVAYQKPRCE